MAYQIRPATQADQPAITAMVRAAGINPLSLHWPRFRVAEDAGRVVGVAQIKVHGDGSRELASLAAAPDRQGEGIGGALVQHLLAQPEGQPPLYLMCAQPLESYYIRFGFRRVERAEMPALLSPDDPRGGRFHRHRRALRRAAQGYRHAPRWRGPNSLTLLTNRDELTGERAGPLLPRHHETVNAHVPGPRRDQRGSGTLSSLS